MCSSSSPVLIGITSPLRRWACEGVTSRPVRADSQGKRAPARPSRARRGASGRQPAHAVLEQRACGLRPCRREERQHEDIRIPEDVPAVARPADAARAERGLARLADGRHQVEEREADVPLELRRRPRSARRPRSQRRAHARRCSRSKPLEAALFRRAATCATASAGVRTPVDDPTRTRQGARAAGRAAPNRLRRRPRRRRRRCPRRHPVAPPGTSPLRTRLRGGGQSSGRSDLRQPPCTSARSTAVPGPRDRGETDAAQPSPASSNRRPVRRSSTRTSGWGGAPSASSRLQTGQPSRWLCAPSSS